MRTMFQPYARQLETLPEVQREEQDEARGRARRATVFSPYGRIEEEPDRKQTQVSINLSHRVSVAEDEQHT